MTIKRKTIEDIIASREENGGLNTENGGLNTESGGLNGGLNKNNCHEVIINSRQKRIISLIKLKSTIIVEQMTSILSISKRSLERDLSMLQRQVS